MDGRVRDESRSREEAGGSERERRHRGMQALMNGRGSDRQTKQGEDVSHGAQSNKREGRRGREGGGEGCVCRSEQSETEAQGGWGAAASFRPPYNASMRSRHSRRSCVRSARPASAEAKPSEWEAAAAPPGGRAPHSRRARCARRSSAAEPGGGGNRAQSRFGARRPRRVATQRAVHCFARDLTWRRSVFIVI